jgi:hypothetical protein
LGAKLGTSKRYADAVDRRVIERVAQAVMRDQQPETISPGELDLANEPLTRTPVARPAKAWNRFGGVPLLIDCEGVA